MKNSNLKKVIGFILICVMLLMSFSTVAFADEAGLLDCDFDSYVAETKFGNGEQETNPCGWNSFGSATAKYGSIGEDADGNKFLNLTCSSAGNRLNINVAEDELTGGIVKVSFKFKTAETSMTTPIHLFLQNEVDKDVKYMSSTVSGDNNWSSTTLNASAFYFGKLDGGKLTVRNKCSTRTDNQTYTVDVNLLDGSWHTIEYEFNLAEETITAVVDGTNRSDILSFPEEFETEKGIGTIGLTTGDAEKSFHFDAFKAEHVVSSSEGGFLNCDFEDCSVGNFGTITDTVGNKCGWNSFQAGINKYGEIAEETVTGGEKNRYLNLTGSSQGLRCNINVADEELKGGTVRVSFRFRTPVANQNITALHFFLQNKAGEDQSWMASATWKNDTTNKAGSLKDHAFYFAKLSGASLSVRNVCSTSGSDPYTFSEKPINDGNWHTIKYDFNLETRKIKAYVDNAQSPEEYDFPTEFGQETGVSIGTIGIRTSGQSNYFDDFMVEDITEDAEKVFTVGIPTLTYTGEIGALAGKTITAGVPVTNTLNKDGNITIIYALYSDDELVDANSYKGAYPTGANKTFSHEFTVKTGIKAPTSAKVFAWDGELTDMKPLTKAMEYPIPQN